MPLWLLITGAITTGLCGLGAWLCFLGARDRLGRRVALGLVLVAVGLVWFWLASGGGTGGIAMPRSYVVVVGDDCPDEDVQTVVKSLPTNAAVAFVRLSPAASSRSPESWSSRAALVADREALAQLRSASGAVAWSETKWLEKLAAACRQAHGERGVLQRLWAKPTVLIVRDNGVGWRSLSPRDQDVGTIANALREADVQLFVTDNRRPSRSGRLRFALERQPIEAGLSQMRYERLFIDIDFPPSWNQESATVSWLELSLDDRVFGGEYDKRAWTQGEFRKLPGSENSYRYHWKNDQGPPIPFVRLNQLVPRGDERETELVVFKPGFRKLRVRAAVRTDDGATVTYEDAFYFEVTSRQLEPVQDLFREIGG